MKRVHFIPKGMSGPNEKIGILVIGCGGTGSRLVSELARLHMMLLRIEHPGLSVTVVDGDKINNANIGRQLFFDDDIGRHKSQVIVERINLNFRFDWEYITTPFKNDPSFYHKMEKNIVISCVDKVSVRKEIVKVLHKIHTKEYTGLYRYRSGYHSYNDNYYHIDCGNGKDFGQVILGTTISVKQPKMKGYETVNRLPGFMKIFSRKELARAEKLDDTAASCSTWEAVEHQDPFINIMVAEYAALMIWNIARNHYITEHGYFINISDTQVTPIKV